MRDVLVFLAAAVVCVPIAARLGLGSVLGYLIAGALIGPWGLGLIARVEGTHRLAELGIVLMLFVIGLELDPRRMATMRRTVFFGGSLQLAASGAALTAALFALGFGATPAIVGGLALAISSTAIATQVMAERNMLPTPTGQASLGILLFQDIAAIPLIGLVPFLGFVDKPATDPVWVRLAIAVAAVLAVVFFGRYLLRPLLRFVARVDIREVFTAFALLVVIGVAYVMELAGVSMALGAFIAGVVLAGTEFRHALESDLEPFKGLLLGLFFISIGMTIDFGLLATRPLTVAALLAGFLAIKVASLWAIARTLDVRRDRWLFAFLLSQGGEFAFVVFAVAREARIFTGEWEGLLTIAVALSMATTPLLLLAHDKLVARRASAERAADAVQPDGPVIIAGFGRFGQIVGRLLLANGIRPVVLDHDADQVDSLRRFGYRVYYGDATRLDLLEAAGAREARLLVNAIDDVRDSIALVDRVRANYPGLPIVSRARNVSHYFELKIRGVEVAERETFESALRAGRAALEALGFDRFRARELADLFRRHNIASVEGMLPFYQDEGRRLGMARQGREELERLFARDRERFEREHGPPTSSRTDE